MAVQFNTNGTHDTNHSNDRAVDIDITAMHTYKANLQHDDVNLYLGSINNFLFDAITGRYRKVPRPGDVEFILAGSPCQGFSNANPQGHEAEKSLRNSALVCTTISAIDFYRPKYAILENVPSMAADAKYGNQQANVSHQIMCALIGMGYQCRCLFLDAWHFGAPQTRTRLFIEIAAPGCILPDIPPGSHAHPPGTRERAVGKTAANVKWAERDLNALTSFPHVKVKDFWDDLPSIGNGHLSICIPYPDHKTYWTQNARDLQITASIPHSDCIGPVDLRAPGYTKITPADFRRPGYQYALNRHLIPEHLQFSSPALGNQNWRFMRLCGEQQTPTLTTSMNPTSRVCGNILHYREDRVMTNMEAKRVQGFLDTDVLIGTAKKAYKIIGNSVCRQVAFALGEKLAEAVRKGPKLDLNNLEKPAVEDVSREVIDGQVPRPMKFMVLIEQKKAKRVNSDMHWEHDNHTKGLRDVRMDTTVREVIDRVEVLVTRPRKRVRVTALEEDQ